jgi:hypothetical protein
MPEMLKMNIDSFFKIGSSHKVCQDFASINKVDPDNLYAALSDGCSHAVEIDHLNHTDLGARLLTLSTLNGMEINESVGWSLRILKGLGISKYCLCATLGVLDKDRASLHGDGTITIGYKDGSYASHIIKYDSNTGNEYPFYPLYSLNDIDYPITIRKYKEVYVFSQKGVLLDKNIVELINSTPEHSIEFTSDVSWCVMTSDGLTTFRCDNKAISTEETLSKFFPFTIFSGRFVEKHMNFFYKGVKKSGWDHYDDLSVIGIHI